MILPVIVQVGGEAGLPAFQQVHFTDGGLDGRSVHIQPALVQLVLDVLIFIAAPARTVDLFGGVDQDADGGQQVFLLLSIGSCLQPGDNAQGDPAGEERNLRLQDGGEVDGIHGLCSLLLFVFRFQGGAGQRTDDAVRFQLVLRLELGPEFFDPNNPHGAHGDGGDPDNPSPDIILPYVDAYNGAGFGAEVTPWQEMPPVEINF
mgnify:CR=1 FL=1